MGKASRSSSNAARLGQGPDEPDEDADMYEAAAPVSDVLVDGFIVPKVLYSLLSALQRLLLLGKCSFVA